MKLTWFGQSCFKVESGESTLIIDPYKDGMMGELSDVRETADAVICSHEHPDHNARDTVTLTGKKCGIKITELAGYHDNLKGKLRGPNTMFILEDGEVRVAHLGDIGCTPTTEQMEQLKGLDVVLVPVGGFFTIDGKQAAELVRELQPKLVIPMHYRLSKKGMPMISTEENFTKRMENVTVADGSTYDTAEKRSGVLVLKAKNQR